jgi:hypothetical protein
VIQGNVNKISIAGFEAGNIQALGRNYTPSSESHTIKRNEA